MHEMFFKRKLPVTRAWAPEDTYLPIQDLCLIGGELELLLE
jgi:hypothetical protein